MKWRIGTVLLLCMVVFFAPVVSSAATIYANSSTGDDDTGDGSSGSPYATFHKAYTEAAASGDTIDLTGTFDWSNAGETGDASGSGYTLGKSLTIQGQGVSSTYIQASSTDNTADRGVFTVSSGQTVTVKNLTVRYGVASGGDRGGAFTNSGTLNIENAALTYNRYNSTVSNGGGAIYLPNSANSTLNISTSTLAYNGFDGRYYGAGAVYSGQSNTINITASTFHNNVATSTNPTTFTYSYAEPSGALGVFRFVTTTVTNSTFSNNSTNSYAGAMQIYYPYSFKITNTTIANNNADAGAGAINFESPTNNYHIHMKNTILANNTTDGGDNDFYTNAGSSGRITDNGYNIVENSTNKTWSGTGNITGDQASLNLAATVADNSALNGVQTLALSSGSVAINAGDDATHSSIAIPSYDQRGGTRSGDTDIGSFEFGAGGLTDETAPTVSVSAPSASSTVSGAAVSVTASATDNVSVAGVTFYVDGTAEGSEDTSSPYAITWDSTGVADGAHTILAVARDSSDNVATSSSIAVTVDNTAPTLSLIATSTATSTATITWTTNEAASTRVYYGLTASYGSSIAETDTSPRVTSHTGSLSGLANCTQYHYQVQSIDAATNTATSTNDTFTTAGCTASASVSTSTSSGIATSTGGTVSSGNLTLTVPTNFTGTSSSAVFQAHRLDGDTFFTSAGAPTGKTRAGSIVYNLKALINASTTLPTFSSALSVTLSYSDSDIDGLDESSLEIYRYSSSAWSALSSCTVDEGANTVTCTTTAFSEFAIFGDESSSSSSSSSSSGGEGTIVGLLGSTAPYKSIGYVEPRAQIVYPDGRVEYVDTTVTATDVIEAKEEEAVPEVPEYVEQEPPAPEVGKYIFTRTLRAHMEGEDVLELQKFLNAHGFTVAARGVGSPGNETNYFGPLTYNALIKFQEEYAKEILEPIGLTTGTGIFAKMTREFVNSL